MTEMTRMQQLLADLRESRAEWDQALARIGETNMTIPGVAGDWTIKDLIAHLTFWENRPVKWLEAAQNGTKPEPSEMPKDLTEDEENAWIYERNRERALNDVIAESRAVHDAVVNRVANLSERELFETPHDWLGNNSLAAAMPGNTYEHYRDHTATVRAWWDSRNESTRL